MATTTGKVLPFPDARERRMFDQLLEIFLSKDPDELRMWRAVQREIQRERLAVLKEALEILEEHKKTTTKGGDA